MDQQLHSPARRLIELRIAHAELDEQIDTLAGQPQPDELCMRRLKKQRLALRDEIARLEMVCSPDEPA